MQYRKFGNIEFEVSALGFGAMRFPIIGDDVGNVDRPAAVRLLRHAIDNGVNYVDTAYPYHKEQSEIVLGEALRDGYRERIRLADKLPTWLVKDESDVERLLDIQLGRLGTDHIDFYLCHNLNAMTWPLVEKHNILGKLEEARKKGKIGHIGFSFHDTLDLFRTIIDYYPGWEFTQIQYNYVNETVQAGTAGLEYAASKGLAVVIMEPLLGGCLANPPETVRMILNASSRPHWTPVAWALHWLWNRPEVATVLSGMGTMAQLDENLASAGASRVGAMTSEDIETLRQAALAYQEMNPIPCTKCRYCMPCPSGVDIPRNFEMYNNYKIFQGNQDFLNRVIYTNFLTLEARAENCTECGECLPKCPQSIPIPELMPKVHAELGVSPLG